jgi:predicted MFS family arabinose efflux permease
MSTQAQFAPMDGSAVRRPANEISQSRAYVALVALLLTYMMSYIDRTALGVLQEPIKREFGLSDWQLGLLGGPAFAILYSLASLPIARLAERFSRSKLIAACLFVWSAMTILCGLSQSYAQLLFARIGVSLGEAGGNPASHSLIADLFPPERRARALSVYTFGVPVGAFLGSALAGWFAHLWGWRSAFYILGAIGAALILPFLLMMPAVPRGRFDNGTVQAKPPATMEVLRVLGGNAAFRQLAAGASLVVLVGYSVAAFLPSFLIRVHGLEVAQVGLVAGLVNGAAAGAGTLFGGFAADRYGQRDIRFYAWMPAGMVLIAAPCFVAGFAWGSNLWPAVALLMMGTAGIYTYIAPTFARVHAMVDSRMRATAASVLFLIINLIGLGLGPTLVGYISDKTAAIEFARGSADDFATLCRSKPPTAGVELACQSASAHGITVALMAVSMLLVWGGVHFWMAGIRLKRSPV